MPEHLRIWHAVQHQSRLFDTDCNADRSASEEATRVSRLSPRRLCPVSATEEGLTAALAAARAVISNSVLPSSNDMSRAAAATP